jgi:transcriptional regulator with XRE-family HTH domain
MQLIPPYPFAFATLASAAEPIDVFATSTIPKEYPMPHIMSSGIVSVLGMTAKLDSTWHGLGVPNLPKTIAGRLREARKAAGLTQAELAAQADTMQSTISRYEREGDKSEHSSAHLSRIAGVLNVTFEWLQTGQAAPPQPTVVTDDKYPKRAEAIQRLAGTISAAALEHVKSLQLAADRRWSVIDWVDELTTAERRFGTDRRRIGETTYPVDER